MSETTHAIVRALGLYNLHRIIGDGAQFGVISGIVAVDVSCVLGALDLRPGEGQEEERDETQEKAIHLGGATSADDQLERMDSTGMVFDE